MAKVEIDFALLQCLIFNAGRSAQVSSYAAWDDAFCRRWIVDGLDKSYEALKDVFDFTKFSKEELQVIGFGEWKNNLMLIPLYLFPLIPEGTELVSISGKKSVVGTDYIDLDVRFNCIAYGFQLPTEENAPNDQTIHTH